MALKSHMPHKPPCQRQANTLVGPSRAQPGWPLIGGNNLICLDWPAMTQAQHLYVMKWKLFELGPYWQSAPFRSSLPRVSKVLNSAGPQKHVTERLRNSEKSPKGQECLWARYRLCSRSCRLEHLPALRVCPN